MMHFLTFAGKSSHDFGIHISGEGTYNRPRRKFEEYSVPGRNGTLIIDDDSFENITIAYPSYVVDKMPQHIEDFANYISQFKGYQRLEDTYSPETFRLAQYSAGLEIKSKGYMNRMGTFDIEFNCKPQRFLKSGEKKITYSAAGTIWNRTNYASKPLLRVHGSGAGTVSIGDYTISITAISSYVDIDCELMDAYKGAANRNQYVSFNADTFKIDPGTHGVSFTGAITKVDVTPRFFII